MQIKVKKRYFRTKLNPTETSVLSWFVVVDTLPTVRRPRFKSQLDPFLCGVCMFTACMPGLFPTVQNHAA